VQRDRSARPRRYNALDQEPGCSLQEAAPGAAHPAPAEAGDCARPRPDETAGRFSDNRDGLRAISAGCRGHSRRIQDKWRFGGDGIRRAAVAGTPLGRRRSAANGTSTARKHVGKNGSNGAANGIPPNRFRPDPLRKSEYRNSYRVPYCIPASGAVGTPPAAGCCFIEFITLRSRGSLAPAYHAETGSVSARPLTVGPRATATRTPARRSQVFLTYGTS
jgi:hypothetical protein